jgi:hypothetical protein
MSSFVGIVMGWVYLVIEVFGKLVGDEGFNTLETGESLS